MRSPEIRRLSENVIRRIAAGEIINSPADAFKEMLENSIDADSNFIEVVFFAKSQFQIRDDGHGIRFADFPILCQRYTTSKLRRFEDLQSVDTLGFRGEALCSVSCFARLTVTARPTDQQYGLRAVYVDGQIVDGPTAVPSLPGTTMLVHEVQHRDHLRPNLQSSREMEVLKAYAIHIKGIGFSARLQGRTLDVSVEKGDDRSGRAKKVFGCSLISFEKEIKLRGGLGCRLEGLISGSEYRGRKRFLIFVNDRLVQCDPLKRATDEVYATLLPKRDWMVYISIGLPLSCVDINVHPSKREVEVLNIDLIISGIVDILKSKLSRSDSCRVAASQVIAKHACFGPPVVDVTAMNCSGLLKGALGVESDLEFCRELIERHSLVGVLAGRFIFVQYEDVLYSLDMVALSRDFFSDLLRDRTKKFEKLKLGNPLDIESVLDSVTPLKAIRKIKRTMDSLTDRRSELDEHLSLEISEEGQLISLPVVLPEYPLVLEKLPEMFRLLSEGLDAFPEKLLPLDPIIDSLAHYFSLSVPCDEVAAEHNKKIIVELLLPSMRELYRPTCERMKDKSIQRVASINELCLRFGR